MMGGFRIGRIFGLVGNFGEGARGSFLPLSQISEKKKQKVSCILIPKIPAKKFLPKRYVGMIFLFLTLPNLN